MKKVLIVGLSEIVGGTETFLMNYYRKINREHIQFDFLTNKEHIAFEDEIMSFSSIHSIFPLIVSI